MAVKLSPSAPKTFKEPKRPKEMGKSQSAIALELARSEYFPIGGTNKFNNQSRTMHSTIGAMTWQASGGIKTEYRSQVGKSSFGMFGQSPAGNIARSAAKEDALVHQLEPIQQHGAGTIIALKKGQVPAGNPAEAQLFQGSRGSRPGWLLGGTTPSVSSRMTEEWGDVRSNPDSEIRRIHELGEKARVVAGKGAAAHLLDPVIQKGEDTIVGVAQGKFLSSSPSEEAVFKGKIGLGSGRRGSERDRKLRRSSSQPADAAMQQKRGITPSPSVTSAGSESWGSVASSPDSELRRIHLLAEKSRAVARKGAAAHQLNAMPSHSEDTILFDYHHGGQGESGS